MTRTNKEIKRNAKENLKGNLGTSFLAEVVSNSIFSIASAVPFAGIIVNGPLQVGKAGIYCENTDGEKPHIRDLFAGFAENIGENFLLGLLKGIFVLLWSMLFIIPGIVKCYGYAMAEYLMARDRNLTASEALAESQRLMKGNKMRLFGLKLSFIGWILLTALTFGIAAVYVVPYMNTAKTEFFNDICNA